MLSEHEKWDESPDLKKCTLWKKIKEEEIQPKMNKEQVTLVISFKLQHYKNINK